MQIFTRIVHNCPIRYDSTQIGLRQSKYNGVDFCPLTYVGGATGCPARAMRPVIINVKDCKTSESGGAPGQGLIY